MERIDEFVLDLILKNPKELSFIVEDEHYNILKGVKTIEEFWSLDICNDITDTMDNYLLNESIEEFGHEIEHEGGDDTIYDDGVWNTVLFENNGWYFYIEPEGQTYGLFSSMDEVEEIKWKL